MQSSERIILPLSVKLHYINTMNASSFSFSPAHEDLLAMASELDATYDLMREEAWDHQEASLMGDDVSEHESDECDEGEFEGAYDGEPLESFDCSDDAEALASAGWGTDEDYGCYGGGDDY